MSRFEISITRLVILISMYIVAIYTEYLVVAPIVSVWFASTLIRDYQAVSKEAVKTRIDKLRQDRKRYPYKYRLDKSHKWID